MPLVHITHTPALSPTQQSPGLQQEVVVKAPRDRANTVLLVTGSISRWCGTENRKGNVSFSPDTQNATAVGGHRLQTEISEPHWLPLGVGGREGVGKITREAGRQ